MGASGSGKTSLLRAIAGLWRSGSGTITRYICEGSGEMHGTERHGENGSTHAIVSVLDFFSICNCQQWSHTGAESLFDMGDCNILSAFVATSVEFSGDQFLEVFAECLEDRAHLVVSSTNLVLGVVKGAPACA